MKEIFIFFIRKKQPFIFIFVNIVAQSYTMFIIRVLFFLSIILHSYTANSQLYVSSSMKVSDGGIVSVINSNVHTDGSGLLENAGLVYVDNDIVNDATIGGATTNTGVFQLKGDWINNSIFNADMSTVEMDGGIQFITGTAVTTFYNLNLTGSGMKIQTIDSKTSFLDLEDNELATQDYVMSVLSPSVSAINRTTGFVSSLSSGHLQRNTNVISDYLFPTGSSSTGSIIYRPIIITPTKVTDNTFGVRMANVNASNEGYPLSTRESNIKNLNPSYYHHIYNHKNTSKADVTFLYIASDDGEYENVAHWNYSSI